MKKILFLFIIFPTLAFAGSDDITKSGFLKKPSTPFSFALAEMFPDLKADRLVMFNFFEYLITSVFNLFT